MLAFAGTRIRYAVGGLQVLESKKQKRMNKRKIVWLAALCCVVGTLRAEMPRDYYPSTMEGKNQRELKTVLHELVKNHRRIAYGSRNYDNCCTWTVFKTSDRRPDGTVWDMYSDETFRFSGGATSGMNIEHSVPKSWWGDSNYDDTTPGYPYTYDATYDLHHLVPSEAKANSAKSNYPLGEVTSATFDNGVSKVGTAYVSGRSTNVFEPADEYKGDFARMYFYFVTCYQDYTWASLAPLMFERNAYPTLTTYGKSLLLRWHRNDPVSQKEKDRNNAVYSFQNNRNPYIDYPNLVEYIWGDSIDYAFSFSGNSSLASSLNIKDGDVVDFGSVPSGDMQNRTLYIKGANLSSDIRVSIKNGNAMFSITSGRTLYADELNTTGVDLGLSYSPRSEGQHEGILLVESDDLETPLEIKLKGLCMASEIPWVLIDGLKATYRKTDARVALRLSGTTESATWTIDGRSVSGYFDPASFDVGIHTIRFKTATYTGLMRVEIVK